MNPYESWTLDEITELFVERAAVAEFDGGHNREDAERMTAIWLKKEIGAKRFIEWDKETK